jgi:hypothetical protein
MLVTGSVLASTSGTAQASQILIRNAKYPSIAVWDRNGTQIAAVTYFTGRDWQHVLVWGAINARPPSPTIPQVQFKLDYSGGYGSFGTGFWKRVQSHNTCTNDTTLGIKWRVASCTMPDGSHWALQNWQRLIPNMGKPPTVAQRAYELHVSHWSGALPVLWLKFDWSNWGKPPWDHMYGVFSYAGHPQFGYTSTAGGNPLDSYGRNVYVDIQTTHWTGFKQPGSWYRFNGFLTHRTFGNVCATVMPNLFGRHEDPYGATAYRATVEGPGVTPLTFWQGPAPGGYTVGGTAQYMADGFTSGPMFFSQPDPINTILTMATAWKDLDDEQLATATSTDPTCSVVHGPK